MPLASTSTMSFVEVSPSTVRLLKVRSTTRLSMRSRLVLSTAASVVMKQSMVAMFGLIMPEPFAQPPMMNLPVSRATS